MPPVCTGAPHRGTSPAIVFDFELLYPLEDNDFGLKTGIRIEDGFAIPPDAPGLGIDYDWDAIDDCTVAAL